MVLAERVSNAMRSRVVLSAWAEAEAPSTVR